MQSKQSSSNQKTNIHIKVLQKKTKKEKRKKRKKKKGEFEKRKEGKTSYNLSKKNNQKKIWKKMLERKINLLSSTIHIYIQKKTNFFFERNEIKKARMIF